MYDILHKEGFYRFMGIKGKMKEELELLGYFARK